MADLCLHLIKLSAEQNENGFSIDLQVRWNVSKRADIALEVEIRKLKKK